ncbi:MAG TPA: capsule assembly Wzi family protein [Acidobacteriaceae bacterium]|jgi:hypothetical protein
MHVLRTLLLLGLPLMLNVTLHAEGSSAAQQSAAHVTDPASTYVPIESWVYAAIDRLASEGYIQSAFNSLRPWTRTECQRLLEEAHDRFDADYAPEDAAPLLHRLDVEFTPEAQRIDGTRRGEAVIESIDTRTTFIAGRPLADGYHFASTIVNDYGRPFGQGLNTYSGLSARAASGPFAAYVRVEVQQVPALPSLSSTVQSAIAAADITRTAAVGPFANFTRGRLLDAYGSFTFSGNQISLGQQTLWWGPARSGATLFSNNAEPILMLRYDRVHPFMLPGFLRVLGPVRAQFMVGRLGGTQFTQVAGTMYGAPGVALSDQPFLHGEKISFKPTPNFEFSVSRTLLFGGNGSPVNTATFFRSIASVGTNNDKNDPGDRRSGVDVQYRIPGLRQCLTGYFDGFADDQPFPLVYPTESAWLSGLSLRCVPRLPRLSLRAEGLLTPHRNLTFPGFFYYNVHFVSGYTNQRQLIGSWIGREGDGEQLWATWQLSPRSSLEVSGRSMTVNREFLQGGSLRDLRFAADIAVHPEWQLHIEGQTEWWHFPLLDAQPQHNAAVTLQLSYRPAARTQ